MYARVGKAAMDKIRCPAMMKVIGPPVIPKCFFLKRTSYGRLGTKLRMVRGCYERDGYGRLGTASTMVPDCYERAIYCGRVYS